MKRTTGWLAGGYMLSATGCALATLRSRAAFGDLSIYAAGGAAVLHGTPLYQLRFAFGLRFTYPPFAALLFAPLTWLPVTAGRVLVSAATVLALPVTSYLVLRLPPWPAQLVRGPGPGGPAGAGLLRGRHLAGTGADEPEVRPDQRVA